MSKRNRISQKTSIRRRTWVLSAALLAVVIIAIGFVVWKSSVMSVYPAEIMPEQALAEQSSGALILDVREPSEWAEYHIPGAVLLPLGQLSSRLSEIPHGRKIVVVCRSGNRSQSGRDILLKAGYTQVTSMAGGLKAWRSQGYPTES